VWAVVVAAGSGERFGSQKQYEQLGDRRVLDWAVAGARTVADGVVLVVPADRAGEPEVSVDAVVAGADTRSGSVRSGLRAVPDDVRVVVVHDAARPLAPGSLFAAVVAAVRAGADAAVPGLPVADTVKQVAGGQVVRTIDRTALVTVQTPQAFDATALRSAHAGNADAPDDAALVEAAGGRVDVVPGHPRALKLTGPDDLVVAAALLHDGERLSESDRA
jgi:2-C-methyl-D-erythritol 4-phosphate cytidylyltransferase